MRGRLPSGSELIIAETLDATADLVVRELASRGMPVMRLDMADFPQQLTLSIEHEQQPWRGVLADEYRSVRLEEVRGVYYRRPGLPATANSLAEPHRSWADSQALAGLLGTLYALDDVVWLNRPDVDGMASHKPGQLPVAARCGLHTPRSLITNDPPAARRFCRTLDGRVICKPLTGGGLRYSDGRHRAVPTHLIDPQTVDDSVALTAHLFQEWIEKAHEVRLIAVDQHLFAAKIHAGSDAARVNWRTDYDSLTYEVCEIPNAVAKGVLGWMEAFGLNFGAFDFAVTPEGRWVFFECNPSGQWGWIEVKTGLPITAAIADLLTKGAS